LLVLLELTLSTLTISLCQANKWSQSEVGEGSIKPPSLQGDKGKDAIKIDEANIGQVIDGLFVDNTVLEDFMEMDDDLAGDLALDDDKVHQASGGSMALTGNSTTDNSATDKPALKPRKTHHNKRRRAGTNTSARKEGSALKFDYSLPRPLDLDSSFHFLLSLGYLDGVGRAPPNRTYTRYPHSL